MRIHVASVTGTVLIATLLLNAYGAKAALEGPPGGTDVDARMALHNPDEFAWKLFLYLNREAAAKERGVADLTKAITQYGEDRPVVWETWALASGGRAGRVRTVPNVSEVFKDRGAAPVPWAQLPSPTKAVEPPAKRLEGVLEQLGLTETLTLSATGKSHLFALGEQQHILIDPRLAGTQEGDEVRMNEATYEFVRGNQLYSIEGLETRFRSGVGVKFPQSAQEVKAQWVRIGEKDKPRYHWRTLKGKDGQPELWGLAGFHIITRDLPNWFWCDFEHVDTLPQAEQPSIDSVTQDSQGMHPATKGSKWAYYRLRGTQVDFLNSNGSPTILANTQIEKGFQQTSSCITCHARATVGLRESFPDLPSDRTVSLLVFEEVEPALYGSIGNPRQQWFRDARLRPIYMQTDFLWSLPFRALSVSEKPPNQ